MLYDYVKTHQKKKCSAKKSSPNEKSKFITAEAKQYILH